MRGWYILRTLSGYEKRVYDVIRRKIESNELSNIVYDVQIPTEQVTEMKDGKKIVKEQKFYPGYVLIDMEMTKENMRLIRKMVPGVTHFLGAGVNKLPKPLTEKEISSILKKVEQVKEEKESVAKIKFVIDEPVKIIDGPFKGFQGVVEEINVEKSRLKVRVEIFGRPTPVDLHFLQVERIT